MIIKTILFLLLVPGMLLVAFPAWLMQNNPALFSPGLLRWLALPLWAAGAFITLWCAWEFTFRGKGTPSPTHPPKELVVSGLYRFVRNPIYIGVFLVLAGHSLWHPARPILWMLPIVAACSHLFVVLYEEPVLRRTFGGQYEAYCRKVPRWLPRLPKAG